MTFESVLAEQRVLLTGHRGFTGGWLALWLRAIGCEVTGLALPPNTEPNLFSCARVGEQLNSGFGDIRDFATVQTAIEAARPSLVFHLPAQPSVARGFADPRATFTSNVM